MLFPLYLNVNFSDIHISASAPLNIISMRWLFFSSFRKNEEERNEGKRKGKKYARLGFHA
jgi:hypothetical protein